MKITYFKLRFVESIHNPWASRAWSTRERAIEAAMSLGTELAAFGTPFDPLPDTQYERMDIRVERVQDPFLGKIVLVRSMWRARSRRDVVDVETVEVEGKVYSREVRRVELGEWTMVHDHRGRLLECQERIVVYPVVVAIEGEPAELVVVP